MKKIWIIYRSWLEGGGHGDGAAAMIIEFQPNFFDSEPLAWELAERLNKEHLDNWTVREFYQ